MRTKSDQQGEKYMMFSSTLLLSWTLRALSSYNFFSKIFSI